ncbi:MAG: hypothetical protein QOG53_832 [Frankiales bacterium]|nr:hypothetical protein [Frankiales bacterium]
MLVTLVALVFASSATAAPTFVRSVDRPVLSPTVGFYDDYMIASPSVVNVGGVLHMVYAGHCQKPAGGTPGLPPTQTCPGDSGIFLLGATSRDGRAWTKRSTPVLSADPALRWMRNGVAEAELVSGPDGWFYLFFTGLGPLESRSIGVARSRHPFGPWEVNPRPVLTGSTSLSSLSTAKVLAPGIRIEVARGRVLMWFNGTNRAEIGWDIYVATARWPLRTAQGWQSFHIANGGNRAVIGPYDAGSGDPSVVVENGVYRMFFTCGSPKTNGPPGICEARSRDGMTFTLLADPHVLNPRAGHWDQNLETAFVMRNPLGAGYWMYYIGYGRTYQGAAVGLAAS